jgi:hypothetical protein
MTPRMKAFNALATARGDLVRFMAEKLGHAYPWGRYVLEFEQKAKALGREQERWSSARRQRRR